MIKVFKFGGALMQDADGIRKVASIINDFKNDQLIVVVSALGKTTNKLEEILRLAIDKKDGELKKAIERLKINHIEITDQLFNDAETFRNQLLIQFENLEGQLKQLDVNSYISYDRIVSYGEKFSTFILNAYLQHQKLPCQAIDARSIIITDDNYTSAKINWQQTTEQVNKKIRPALAEGKFVLTEGFIGSDPSGHPTTLGREGSDFTAAILASTLDAEEVTIWKNVPGLMNADPNRFKDCIKLDQISYHEAIELAFYGASVIHPKTIQPLQQKNIPLFVRSFDDLDIPASVISKDMSMDDKLHNIIVKDRQVLLSINSRDLSFIAEDHLMQIFNAFSQHKIHINLMQHSAVSFSVCFDSNINKLQALLSALKNDFIVKYNDDLQLITMRHYTEELISNFVKGKEVFLEQKSRATVQLLIK
ncbi:MAG: aspartate kinase [Bacteroidetes bacterium]|nr:aspartate kinase [Bacteroidota bacterium]